MNVKIYKSDKIYVPYAKIERYLLDPSKAHSDEFFDVGYLPGDGEALFKDLEAGFDKERAGKCRRKANGAVEYIIYMLLGKNKKRTFRTVWREDDIAPLPRFINAFRDKEGEKYV